MHTTIKTIPILPFGMLNAFLVTGPGGPILVDSGLPGSVGAIGRVVRAAGLEWKDIKLIVLSHGHIDHAGSASELRTLTGAPVLYHDAETHYCMGERPVLRPTRLFGRLFRMTGAIERPFPPVSADILMKGEALDLQALGLQGTVLHTPGHTPGHISVNIESKGEKAVISGDLMHHPCQIAKPEWVTPFDNDNEAAMETRKAFLEKYADQPVLILGTHFANPVAGHIVRDGDTYRFNV